MPGEADTLALGAVLAAGLVPGMVIWLEGDLGAGKTTLVRGLLRAAGDSGPVKSPTYTLVEVHVVSGLNFYHFDFYRFNQAEEYLDAGLDEYFSESGICLVEWPDKAAPYLPAADMRIELRVEPCVGDEQLSQGRPKTVAQPPWGAARSAGGALGGRTAQIAAGSVRGRTCLAGVRSSSLPRPV